MATRIRNGWRWTVALGMVAAVSAVALGVLQAQQRGGKPQALSAQDLFEIQQLGARYCYGLDTGADNGSYYANVFTVDGSFGNTVGREKLAAMAREGGGRLKLRGYQHVITNVIIEPSAEGAVGSQYIQVLTVGGQGKPPMIDHGGRYEDIYVKTADGWRIKSRKFVRTFPPT
jgi:SnoaL-like protein